MMEPEEVETERVEEKVDTQKDSVATTAAAAAVADPPVTEEEPKEYDAIIVGGGLGGLSAGKKVLVVEQHDKVGGCGTTFKRRGFTFDVGLHVFPGFGEPSPYNLMLKLDKACGLQNDSSFELVPLPELYRVVNYNGLDTTIPINMDEAIRTLCEQYPEDTDGIKKFFETSTKMNDDILKYNRSISEYGVGLARFRSAFVYPSLVKGSLWDTAGNVMDKLFKNENLKMALSAIIFFIATDPYVLPFTPFCFLFPMYMNDGAYYVKGGSQKLSDALARIITTHGGEIRTNALVNHINTSPSAKANQWWNPFKNSVKVDGVVFEDKIRKQAHTAKSDVVILNSNLRNFPELLSTEAKELAGVHDEVEKLNNIRLGTSCFCIYIAFSKRLPDLPNGKKVPYTTWSLGNAKTLKEIHESMFKPFNERYFIFSYFSSVQSGLEPEGRPEAGVGAVILPDRYEDWEHYDRTSQEYKDKKEECCRLVIDQLEKIYPHIKDCIEFYEGASPLTMKRYLHTPRGDMYSWEMSNKHYLGERPDLKSDSIDGLYYSSSWSGFSHGFPGVMTTGYRCSELILENERKTKK